MADVIGALVALLKVDAGVAAIAGEHTYGGELAAAVTAAMPRAALVLDFSGGISITAGSYAELDTKRVDLTAYGATRREADQLRIAAETVLRRVDRVVSAGVLIHSAQSAGGPFGGRDRNFAWPQVTQPFQVLFSMKEV